MQFTIEKPSQPRTRREVTFLVAAEIWRRTDGAPGLYEPEVGHDDDCGMQHGSDRCECALLVDL